MQTILIAHTLTDLDLDYVSGGGPDGGAPADGGAAGGGAQSKPAPKQDTKGDGDKGGAKKDPATLEIKGDVHGGEGKPIGWKAEGTLKLPLW